MKELTPAMRDRLSLMNNGKRFLARRGRTMLALEDRGLVERHLPEDTRFACRFTITSAGRAVVQSLP